MSDRPARNEGTTFEPEWLDDLHVDPREAEAAAAALEARTVTGADLVARLRLAVSLLDLTSLDERDTEDTVRALCAQAVEPLPEGRPSAAGGPVLHVAAVCVYDRLVSVARDALSGHDVRVAAVTGGFPHPHADRARRLEEVRRTMAAGADEVDVVITREHATRGHWAALYEEVRELRGACGPALLKTILAAGDLGSLDVVARAGLVCCMAGADFIKTSTGREQVNATLPIGLAMCAALTRYHERSGHTVGLKPAGGIRTAEQALSWLRLAEERLGGRDALVPTRLRIGASSLLDRIRDRLGAPGVARE